MKICAIGPYIGDFEQEITTFRPFARWHSEVIDADRIYLTTHSNRIFLYNWIKKENIFPVYEDLTRDELNQKGYVHKTIQQKDFAILVRKFKNIISDICNCNKKNIIFYNLGYVKNAPACSIYNKLFNPIIIPEIDVDDSSEIVYIPHIKEDKKRADRIYNHLSKKYDCIIVGDMKVHFPDENRVLKQIDYFENCYKYIIKYISKAKAVICPISHWTILCNLQKVPVFSWGKRPGPFRTDGGIYNFSNQKTMTFATDDDTSADNITNMIDYFIGGL